MKKIFLTIAIAAASLSASAQVYVDGTVGVWRNSDDNTTDLTIRPSVGYNLSDKWALGIGLGYDYNYKGTSSDFLNTKTHSLTIDPYARYSFVKFGPVSFFLDMGAGIEVDKTKCTEEVTGRELSTTNTETGWYVGVKPGVKVSLTQKIDFVAHLGFLGYRDNLEYEGFGFGFTSQSVNFGIAYNF